MSIATNTMLNAPNASTATSKIPVKLIMAFPIHVCPVKKLLFALPVYAACANFAHPSAASHAPNYNSPTCRMRNLAKHGDGTVRVVRIVPAVIRCIRRDCRKDYGKSDLAHARRSPLNCCATMASDEKASMLAEAGKSRSVVPAPLRPIPGNLKLTGV
jgi:hypothetical protein